MKSVIIESMSTEQSTFEGRVRAHAALGDPVRLAVVDRLVLADASSSELAEQLDVAGNLLAHHLNVLQAAGLIRRRRSDGDARRGYVQLVRDAPVLRDLLPPVHTLTARRVVFVCTHNSARSQLAGALWRRRSRVPMASGGTHPAARVNPEAVAAARRHGLRLGRATPRHVGDVVTDGDLVVAVCDQVHEELPANRPRLHWSIPDPSRVGTPDAFDDVVEALSERIARFAPAVRTP
jgi:protein-tyrosine-phosphatase